MFVVEVQRKMKKVCHDDGCKRDTILITLCNLQEIHKNSFCAGAHHEFNMHKK